MLNNKFWQRHIMLALFGGCLLLNTVVLAAPTEMSLDDSIMLALKNNPAIKMAGADKDKANWGINEAQAGRLPSLSLGITDSRGQAVETGAPGDNFSNNLRLSLPLYTGGRVEGLIDQAELGAKVADLGVEKARQQVRLDVTTAYFDALQARNLVKVGQETVDSLTQHLKNVQAQYDAGATAKADVLRSDVELANAQQNLIKVENSYELAMANLNNITGRSLDTPGILRDDLSYSHYDESLEHSIKLALENRPEIAQVATNTSIAKEGIKVAESGRLPSVAFNGATGWSDSTFPGTKNNNWSLSLTANWNVFDSGMTNAKIKGAEASLDKTIAQAGQTRDSVELEVRQAYLSLREAEKRIGTSQTTVAKAEEDLRIAKVKYYSGAGTNLDVIDASLSLTQAKTNYTQALYDYNVDKAKLDKATGVKTK